jgi:hypothetical protein
MALEAIARCTDQQHSVRRLGPVTLAALEGAVIRVVEWPVTRLRFRRRRRNRRNGPDGETEKNHAWMNADRRPHDLRGCAVDHPTRNVRPADCRRNRSTQARART